jgi:hypothetical protein
MIETVEVLVRANGAHLMWFSVTCWAAIAFGALGVSSWSRDRERRAWFGIAALALVFAVEMAHPYRYWLTEQLRQALRAVGGDEGARGRRPIQAAVILIVLVAASGLLADFLARARCLATSGKLGVMGVGIGLLGFVLETISLHQVDRYYTIYWSIWFLGIALAASGVVGALAARGGAASPTGPSRWERNRRSGAAPSPHARYSVGSIGVRVEGDPPLRRVARLGLVLLVLALPELVGLVSRLIRVR